MNTFLSEKLVNSNSSADNWSYAPMVSSRSGKCNNLLQTDQNHPSITVVIQKNYINFRTVLVPRNMGVLEYYGFWSPAYLDQWGTCQISETLWRVGKAMLPGIVWLHVSRVFWLARVLIVCANLIRIAYQVLFPVWFSTPGSIFYGCTGSVRRKCTRNLHDNTISPYSTCRDLQCYCTGQWERYCRVACPCSDYDAEEDVCSAYHTFDDGWTTVPIKSKKERDPVDKGLSQGPRKIKDTTRIHGIKPPVNGEIYGTGVVPVGFTARSIPPGVPEWEGNRGQGESGRHKKLSLQKTRSF